MLFCGSVSLFLLLAVLQPLSAQSPYPNVINGEWGTVFDMNVIPIHAVLLPDGQVLAYGTDNQGEQGAQLYYEVWNVKSGKHHLSHNHNLLNHSTMTNMFCSTISMDVKTGNVLIIGGDNGFNEGIQDTLEFNSKTLEVRKHPLGDMRYPRWYASSINLPNGDIFVVGGKAGTAAVASPIPEIWSPDSGWRELQGATVASMADFRNKWWWYPHVYVNTSGDIILIMAHGANSDVYCVGVAGNGTITKIGTKPFYSDMRGSSIMYDVDQIAMIDNDGALWVVNITDSYNPVFSENTNLGKARTNGVMSSLPDGRVIITGGCESIARACQNVTNAVLSVQIWDPISNTVFTGPNQEIPRLYHSTALILPDGTVFSAGGGAPGPLLNLNGQVYSPGYLFSPETGGLASRPLMILSRNKIRAGQRLSLIVDDPYDIIKVTATMSGSVTHSRNSNSRWVNLEFDVARDGSAIRVSTPSRDVMVPGVWLIAVINKAGVPSKARLLQVGMRNNYVA